MARACNGEDVCTKAWAPSFSCRYLLIRTPPAHCAGGVLPSRICHAFLFGGGLSLAMHNTDHSNDDAEDLERVHTARRTALSD